LLAQERGGGFTVDQRREETGFDIGRFVDTWRYAISQQFKQESFFAGGRVLQQLNQTCGLFGVQRLGHDTLSGTLFYVFAISFKHSISLISCPKGVRDALRDNRRTVRVAAF